MIFNMTDRNMENFIDGRYVTGDLNFTCGLQSICHCTNIMCSDTNCNVNCLAYNYGAGGCQHVTVFGSINSNIKWYCSQDSSLVCDESRLACSKNDSVPLFSYWVHDDINGWHYRSGNCIESSVTLTHELQKPIHCEKKIIFSYQ